MRLPEKLQERLADHEQSGCLRELRLRQGLDFCSNDYLRFADDVELQKRVRDSLESVPLGASGSRLLRGHLALFEETETALAGFCGREAALLFPSGYQANVGLLSAVLRPGDLVFSDERNHASLIDGIRLSRAEKRIYPHLDLPSLRTALEGARKAKGLKVIVTESLFSMDGDIAPLRELVELAEEHEAVLIVDEAHATGLWGKFDQTLGGGIVQSLGLASRVFATVHTGGKALGSGSAWIACDSRLKEYLVNFSRPFIFSTAPVPFAAIALRESIDHWRKVGVARARELHRKSELFGSYLGSAVPHQGMILAAGGPIFPVLLGENERTLHVSQELQDKGFDVRAIRPPTVAEGTARLRITIQWDQSLEVLQSLAAALGRILARSD